MEGTDHTLRAMGILAQNESSTSRTSTSIGESSRRDSSSTNQTMYDQAREFSVYQEQQERQRRQRSEELTRRIEGGLQRSNDLMRNMRETRQRVRTQNQSRSDSYHIDELARRVRMRNQSQGGRYSQDLSLGENNVVDLVSD